MLEDRLLGTSRQHWVEFAALVAGGSATALVVAVGGVTTGSQPWLVNVLILEMSIAAFATTMVSYYGIINGTTFSVAPLGPLNIAAALVIAGAQVGAALLLATVATAAKDQYPEVRSYVEVLRHFLLAEAVLALSAALANVAGARERERYSDLVIAKLRPRVGVIAAFDEAQSQEVRGAVTGGAVAAGGWVLSLIWSTPWVLVVAVAVQIIGVAIQLSLQRNASAHVWELQLRPASSLDTSSERSSLDEPPT